MINNLIRFVANTKAKASEVNYNFDQVKAKIQELDDWKTSTDDKLNKYSSFQLFDLIVTDRVLTGEEAKGKLLQGSLVTNLYPDAVAKIKDEWDNGAEQTYTFGEDISFPYRLAANRHMIVDILYKDDVDALFSATGVAWFYIWDKDNEQFYLPRSLWFDQYTNDPEKVNKYNEPQIPNITGSISSLLMNINAKGSGCHRVERHGNAVQGSSAYGQIHTMFTDLSRVNSIYKDDCNTVQPPSINKLLYFVVGNTYVNQEDIDLAQLETGKANINADNFSDIGKAEITSWGIPNHNATTTLTLPSAGQIYTVPYDCYMYFCDTGSAGGGAVVLRLNSSSGAIVVEVGTTNNDSYSIQGVNFAKGTKLYVQNDKNITTKTICPLIGAEI